MTIFTKLKMSRKAAKEHKGKAIEKEVTAATAPKVPYKHVPTHAAVDALSGAPSSWQHHDAPRIKEQHRRRSELNMSRAGSSSNVSYLHSAAGNAISTPPLPRATSYHTTSPTWFDRTGDVGFTFDSSKSRHMSRATSYVGPSPLGSKNSAEELPPADSGKSQSCTSSSENLEIAGPSNSKRPQLSQPSILPPMSLLSSKTLLDNESPAESNMEGSSRNNSNNRFSFRPQPIVYEERDVFNRLHTSTHRKVGEAPIMDAPPPAVVKPVVPVASPEPKMKKNRWSIMSKKRTSAIVS